MRRQFSSAHVWGAVGAAIGFCGVALCITALTPLCSQDTSAMAACSGWAQAGGTIAAVFAAIGVGVRQMTSEHRRQVLLSKPRLGFEPLFQEDRPQFELTLENTGLGPAILTTFEVLLDGQPRDMARLIWLDLIDELGLPKCDASGGAIPDAGEAIRPGIRRMIVIYNATGKTPGRRAVKAAFDRIRITIGYESIDGEKGVVSTDPAYDRHIPFGKP